MNAEILHKNQSTAFNIINNYKRQDGQTDWKRAFNEHPEWERTFEIHNGEDRQRLYTYVSNLKKRMNRKNQTIAFQKGIPITITSESQKITSESQKIEERKEKRRRSQAAYRGRKLSRQQENQTQQTAAQEQMSQEFQGLIHVKHCPCCGVSLEVVDIALRLQK